MRQPDQAPILLATFDPDVALAVVRVLRVRGVEAWTAGSAEGVSPTEAAVMVPPARREEALTVLASAMEEVAAHRRSTGFGEAPDDDLPPVLREVSAGDEPGAPLVLERFRNLGGLVLVLVPLLVITLQVPGRLQPYALVLFVGGIAAVAALRDRGR